MTEQYSYSPEELERLTQMKQAVADFKGVIANLPTDYRSADHNRQFNELRAETERLLKTPFVEEGVPPAATGSSTVAGSVSIIVVLGVILALVGLGINSIILDDLLINSLGCCISSGGMLLVIGAFGVLVTRQMRDRVTEASEMNYLCDLLIYQIDHRLAMVGQYSANIPQTTDFGQPKPPPTMPEENQ